MTIAYKNFWSLNTDEAVVAGILRGETNKDIEVLMPLNAQMKGVDLYLINNKTKEVLSIQVKGSRAYEPKPREVNNFGDGSAGWFFFPETIVSESTADYFIFLIYVIEEDSKLGRRIIQPHTITIPASDLKKKSLECKTTHGDGRYSYKVWVNPTTKEAFDFRDKRLDFSEYLDKAGWDKINKIL